MLNFFNNKILVVAVVLACGAFLLLIIVKQFTAVKYSNNPADLGRTRRLSTESVPSNAFSSSAGSGAPGRFDFGGFPVNFRTSPDEIPVPAASSSLLTNQLQSIVSSLSIPAVGGNLLPLPETTDSEISIDSSGVSNIADFLKYFANHQMTGLDFDFSSFAGILKNSDGTLMLPGALIDKALRDNNFGAVHESLLVYRELLSAEVKFFASVKVNASLAYFTKEVISYNKLGTELIDDAFAVESGGMSLTDFKNFYSRYQATVVSGHDNFVTSSGLLGFNERGNFIYELASAFGLIGIAHAFLPVGGPIIAVFPCTCPPTGLQIVVGPPVGGTYYLTAPFLASPLFFPFRAPHPGAFILGLSAPESLLTCNVFPFCADIIPPIYMAGTSE